MISIRMAISDLCSGYGNVEVLHNITIHFKTNLLYGLVGESGCGKSTLAKTLIGRIPYSSGKIVYFSNEGKEEKRNGTNVLALSQNAYSCFDDGQTVLQALMEVLYLTRHTHSGDRNIIRTSIELFYLKEQFLHRKISSLSGGERQRLALARAYLISPNFIIFDESLDSLDIIHKYLLIKRILEWKKQKEFTALFISHDLSVVRYCCDIIIVMHEGRIVEVIHSEELIRTNKKCLHPYTQMLFDASYASSLNSFKMDIGKRVSDAGCPFFLECPYTTEICKKENPKLLEIEPNHYIACHMYRINI